VEFTAKVAFKLGSSDVQNTEAIKSDFSVLKVHLLAVPSGKLFYFVGTLFTDV
jgi:hypothetical protein